jgi:Mg-chelatase subunit ChlD
MRFAAILCSILIIQATVVTALCTEEQTKQYLTTGTSFGVAKKEVDYIIVVDRSGSMEGEKLDKVKIAAKSLINQLPSTDRAAIISFNYEAKINQGLTNDHEALFTSIDALRAEYSTKYSPPLILSQKEFATSSRFKGLIFLSDGKSDFSEEPEEILRITEQLAQQQVCILTIGYALNDEESPLLKAMAETGAAYGCGEHFQASEKGSELEAVFSQIYNTLSSTNVLSIHPKVTDGSFELAITSKLNGKPLPGREGDLCADEPQVAFTIFRGSEQLLTLNEPRGTFDLPEGLYTYQANAALRCNGQCNFVGKSEGKFSVGGACNPQYKELATYVTGETQTVQITKSGFVPQSISGRQGTLIVWSNQDEVPRRITSEHFNETVLPGSSYTYIIENVGTLIYADPDRNITGSVKPIHGTGTDVLLVIDESGSMKGAGIAEARLAAQKFFSLLSPVDRGALMTFSHQAYLVQDFTNDRDVLRAKTLTLRAEGATSYMSALDLTTTLRPQQQPVLIFMSDGKPTDGLIDSAYIDAVESLRNQNWCVMTVGFGEEGAQARSLLARMAGTDECAAFLYASGGKLAETFGTIYQLSHEQNDLFFTNVRVPRITTSKYAHVEVQLEAKTGKPVPGGSGICAPEATVQVRSNVDTAILSFKDGSYQGEVPVERGMQTISFVASVSAIDEPGRAFGGTHRATIISVSPILLLIIVSSLSVIIIYFLRRRRV